MYFFSGDVLPQFVGDLTNLTAAIGREAVFSCNIKNLRNYKVSQLFPNFDVFTCAQKRQLPPPLTYQGDFQNIFEDIVELLPKFLKVQYFELRIFIEVQYFLQKS